jgi:hypothetical protein
MRCLAKNPAERFASMTELSRAFDELRGTGSPSRSAPVVRAPSSAPAPHDDNDDDDLLVPARRNPWPWIALGTIALVTAGVVAFVAMRDSAPTKPAIAHADAAVGVDAAIAVDAVPITDAAIALDAALPDPRAEADAILHEIEHELAEMTEQKMQDVRAHGERVVELVARLKPSLAGFPQLANAYATLEVQAGKFVTAAKLADTRDQYAHHRRIADAVRQLRAGLRRSPD